jgi:hypothetical protein
VGAELGAELVTGLLSEVGLSAALADRVELEGDGQPYDTPFPVVECAASVLGCIGAAASLLWEERPYFETSDTPDGRLRHLGPAVRLPVTPARWEVPTSPIGSHAPAWQEATARI